LHGGDLAFEPVQTRERLPLARRLVHAPLATHFELEVLYGVRDVKRLAPPPEHLQRPIEHSSGRSYEGPAFEVFAIAGLLAYQHQPRARLALAPDRLGGGFAERAFAAARGCFPERLQVRRRLDQLEPRLVRRRPGSRSR
jgi:hypothetical protein